MRRMDWKKIEVGDTFGKLTVVELGAKQGKRRDLYWVCLCECGAITKVCSYNLKSSNTRSCGCLIMESITKHGKGKHSAYKSWAAMMARCYNPKHKAFKNYGGRGIAVDKRWHDVNIFIEDMGVRDRHLTLDRIDNSKGYSKENCCWSTYTEQNRNRRSVNILEYKGIQGTLKHLYEVSECSIPFNTVKARIHRGWSIEKALLTPSTKVVTHGT